MVGSEDAGRVGISLRVISRGLQLASLLVCLGRVESEEVERGLGGCI